MEHKYTKEEIIKALKVIKEVCDSAESCCDCPLRHGKGGGCHLEITPANWDFNDEPTKTWRAFV